MQSKNNRNKIKTLCTIDTTDIDLPDNKLFQESSQIRRPASSKNKIA